MEIALYNQRFAKGVLAAQRLEAVIASERMEGVVLSRTSSGSGTSTSDSELSTVLSSRFSGLEED